MGGGPVIFIPSLCGWDERKGEAVGEYVLALALELRFQSTGVEVMTPNKMRAELGAGWEKEEDVHKIIREFLKQRQSRLQQGHSLQVKQLSDPV